MHIPHTPESLLPRSDSKNPAATCRGLTSNGRPCRRAITKSPHTSPTPSPSPRRASSPEAFCWQHREQATLAPSPSQARRPGVIREQTSVDSLFQRLGIQDEEDRKRREKEKKPKRKPLPTKYLDPDIPIPSIEHSPPRHGKEKKKAKKQTGGGFLCCFTELDEIQRAPRPIKSKARVERRSTAQLPAGKQVKTTHMDPERLSRPPIARDPSSRTGEFLSLIPADASPQLTAQLLAELAKPFSASDDEGYIYMFWLTPESLPADPPSRTASTLLAPPFNTPRGQRRTSEVLSTFAASSSKSDTNNKTMLLKIGRAQNVHRRLNQWTRQCGYNLSLIRYYPYHPTSSSMSVNEVPRTPRKVPNAHKIERLIHIELANQRATEGGKCEQCGREHREWFEVEATREGVKTVDAVIRRWVDWGEKQA